MKLSRLLVLLLAALFGYGVGYYTGPGKYVLYTAYFKVIDPASKKPVDAHFTFSDRMDVWPKSPDMRGGITVEMEHGTKAVAWMGLRSLTPVRLPLSVDTSERGFIELKPHPGGFDQLPNPRCTLIELAPPNP